MVIGMIGAGFILLVLCLWFLFQGAPYVKSSQLDSEEILNLAKKYQPKRVLDMGSGNGKLVVMMASHGFRADGIEINPILVWMSRRTIKDLNLQEMARIRWGSFWKFNTSDYDMVTLYAIQHIMPQLETKLMKELPKGAHIVSNYFEFPNLKPVLKTDRLRVYKISK